MKKILLLKQKPARKERKKKSKIGKGINQIILKNQILLKNQNTTAMKKKNFKKKRENIQQRLLVFVPTKKNKNSRWNIVQE